MSVTAWRSHPSSRDIQILDVPSYSERGSNNECLLHCLKMVIDYVSDLYPNEWIRESVNDLEIDKIRQYISVSGAGWNPDDDELQELSGEAGPIEFQHSLKRQSPTEETFYRIIRNHLKRDLPVIPVINAKKLRRNVKAGVHAVVAVGMNDKLVAINDPWGYPFDTVDKKEFIEAWDDTVNQFVTIKLGGQQTLAQENSAGGNK